MTSWRDIQKKNFTSLDALCTFLQLDDQKRSCLLSKPSFSLNLPLRLAEKIKKNTLNDPLLRQFLPLNEELIEYKGFTIDPVDDRRFRKAPKLLQKYEGRALLVLTGACVMNCRFCFRKHFDYEANGGFDREIEEIAKDTCLHEIILSGGDPLSLPTATLKRLFDHLAPLSHIKRVRFHTRFPLGIPERIDEEFLSLLQNTRLQSWFVIHTNHACELDDDVIASLKKIARLGTALLSQTVLLRGVNDSVEALSALFSRLVDAGITPYYLHQLDKVQGSSHFEVSEEEGKRLLKALSERLSGYALPRYVKEVAGEKSKTPILW